MDLFRKHRTFFIVLVSTYLLLVAAYYFTAVGIRNSTFFLQMRRYLPCAVAVALACDLWRRAGYNYKMLLPHAIVSFLWIWVYPVCYWITYHNTFTFIDKHFDQAFGAYFFAFSVCLRLILLRRGKGQDTAVCQRGFAFLHTAALIIPVVQIIYFAYYKYPVTEDASLALLQTNPGEAKEYLLLNFGFTGLAGIVIFFIALFMTMYKLNSLQEITADKIKISSFGKKSVAVLSVVILATVGYGAKMFKDTGVMKTYVAAGDYFTRANNFTVYHKENFNNLTVTPSAPVFAKPSTIIIVIGESASSYYMSAYSDTQNDNTPWLRNMKKNDNFVVFTHAYTSKCQTVPALERALTEKNQYNDKEFNQSLTVIDIAKKAGYKTYWFSNQGYIGGADTPITLVAKTADHAEWLSENKELNGKYQYDGDLLKCLEQVNPEENNFVVLHFMGSHEDCINRYPPEFTKFGEPHKFDTVLNYDNSLAYTDYVLQQVHQYAINKLNLQAMLYFSDHGGDPYRKRHPDVAGFKSLQVPMFVYVSDEYKNLFKESVEVFKKQKNAYFTNDMIYEVVCNLLQIQSNHYDESNSLLNSKYKFTRETLTTNLGTRKLTEDKEPRKDD